MIHIFRNYSFDDAACASMFADRKRLFVDLLGWDVPVVEDRFELDAYDGAQATYLVATDDSGDHIGSMRLLPTQGPHILGDLFAELSCGPVPRGPDILEITRLCLPTRLRATRRLAVRNHLISAMVDHAIAGNVASLTGVVTESFLDQILAMGWRCTPLGEPRLLAGARLAAFRIDLDDRTREDLAANGIYTSPVLAPRAARQAA